MMVTMNGNSVIHVVRGKAPSNGTISMPSHLCKHFTANE